MRWFSTAVLVLVLASPALAAAPLSLEGALQEAQSRHPSLVAARHRVEAARAREIQASALPNPNFTLSAGEIPFAKVQNGNYQAGITQPLLTGPQREARLELARVDTAIAALERQVAVRDLAARVKVAFARLLFHREAVATAKRQVEAARTLLEASRARYRAGDVARLAILRAEVDHSRAQRDVVVAESREGQARGRLNVLLGRDAQAPIAIEGQPTPARGALGALEDYVAQAVAARTELEQARLAIRRETLQRQLALANMWTGSQVSLSAGSIEGGPGAAASLSLPLLFYRQEGEVAEAEANRARAEAEAEALRNTITLEVEEAYRQAAIAADLAARFRQSYLPEAERLAENAHKRYQAGEGDVVEVIEARQAFREMQLAHLEAMLEYRRAQAELERAVGTANQLQEKDS